MRRLRSCQFAFADRRVCREGEADGASPAAVHRVNISGEAAFVAAVERQQISRAFDPETEASTTDQPSEVLRMDHVAFEAAAPLECGTRDRDVRHCASRIFLD